MTEGQSKEDSERRWGTFVKNTFVDNERKRKVRVRHKKFITNTDEESTPRLQKTYFSLSFGPTSTLTRKKML